MDRFAIFVDAGYFFAAGGEAAHGVTQRRQLVFPNPRKCMDDIIKRAATISGNDNLLRVYWYDALTGATPTATQATIARLHGVKLRLGVVNRTGEQKGVDSLIVTDLIDLARNRAIVDAVLVSGDEDLRIAVQVAQAYGVRVHILASGDPGRNVSPSLQMEADSVHHLDEGWFREYLATAPAEQPLQCECTPPIANSGSDLLDAAGSVVEELLAGAGAESIAMLAEHFASSTEVPGEYDRKLIACTAARVRRELTGAEKRQIRGILVSQIRKRNAENTDSV